MNANPVAHPWADYSPMRHPLVIAHFSSMAVALVGCLPMALILGRRRYKKLHQATVAIGSVFLLAGLVTAWLAPAAQSGTLSALHTLLGVVLLLLLLAQCILGWQKSTSTRASAGPLHEPTQWLPLLARVPDNAHLILGWTVLCVAYAYTMLGLLLFTASCSQGAARCVLPLATGAGFVGYGTVVLFHLVGLFQLPRTSTPEHFEGLALAVWGVLCLLMAGTPLLGTSWNAVNLGLLWLAGGLLAVTISMQTWMPALREKNVANALAICLTGRAIIAGYTQQDAYSAEIHSALGGLLIAGSVVRVVQIVFRKTPVDNFSRMFKTLSHALQSPDRASSSSQESDEEMDTDEGTASRHDALSQAYNQLVGQPRLPLSPVTASPCKHESIFASITLVSALLTAILSMATGLLMMGTNVGWLTLTRHYVRDPSTYVNLVLAVALSWAAYVLVVCTIHKSTKASTPFEYLGLDLIDTPPPVVQDSTLTMSEQSRRYEEARNVRRSNSLPSRRSSISRPLSNTTTPTVRPSEYRAKRRSLLLSQSPVQKPHTDSTAPSQRIRSLSNFSGLGHARPELDHVFARDSASSRQSWLLDTGPFHPLRSPGQDTRTHDHRRSILFVDSPIQLGERMKETDEGVASYSSTSSFPSSPVETDASITRFTRNTERGKRKEGQVMPMTLRRRSQEPLSRRHSASSTSSCISTSSNYSRPERSPRSPSAPSSASSHYWTERNSSEHHLN